MKRLWAMLILAGGIFFGAKVDGSSEHSVPVESKAQVAQAVPTPGAPENTKRSGCIVDEAAIGDVQKRRDELEAKAKELQTRESELKAKEKVLEEELKRLEQLRDEVAKSEALGKKESAEKINKLVESVETMSPKVAAQMLARINESLAVTAMSRLSSARLAKIMNVMEPERLSRLSEALAGVVRVKGANLTASSGAAVTTLTDTKGGDKNDRINNQRAIDTERDSTIGKQPSVAGKEVKAEK